MGQGSTTRAQPVGHCPSSTSSMATAHYKDVSPYTRAEARASGTDYLYDRYQSHVALAGNNCTGEKINVALFGAGRAGTIHLSNLAHNPRTRLLYIIDDDRGRWSGLRDFWGLQDTVLLSSGDSGRVFQDTRVHAVIVASPTHTHEAIARAALARGKAVFCEKPVASDADAGRRCYELAREMGRPLFCAFNRRFDSSFAYVREAVRAGHVGHVHMIKVCSRDCPLPSIEYLKQSGGIFHDCAVHDVDMMCWLLGEFPVRVFAMATAHIPEIAAIGDYDTVAIMLAFPSGTTGVIDLSRRACYGYDQRLEVFGPRGMVQCHNEHPHPGYESHCREGTSRTAMWHSFPSRYQAAYASEMEHFLDVVQGKAQMIVLPEETLAVSKVVAAAELSARTGRAIDIDWGA